MRNIEKLRLLKAIAIFIVNFRRRINLYVGCSCLFILLFGTIGALVSSDNKDYGSRFAHHDFYSRLDTFKQHMGDKRIFIETGTYLGTGVVKALLCGFKTIYSCELSPEQFVIAKKELAGIPNVKLYLSDSAEFLSRILSSLKEPAFFWLDAHYSGGNTAQTLVEEDSNKYIKCPLIRELQVIATHNIKTHTILIDDVRLFGTAHHDYITLDEVINALKQINPYYQISFADGYEPNDILVAEIPLISSSL